MSTIPARPAIGQRLLMRGIDWRTYCRLLRVFAEQRSVRLTYDRGRLELMSPVLEDESDADFLGQLVVALTEELGLPRKAGGATTLRRRRKRRGIEPDRCYWIAHEQAVRGKRRIDLRVDPPPDLAIEVDVTNSSLDRLQIYGVLGVREVWRLEDQALTFHHLMPDGSYTSGSHSLTFPLVTPADLLGVLAMGDSQDETTVIGLFRIWVRQRLGATLARP